MKALRTRLIVMNFLEFAIWGAYLTSMGTFLAAHKFFSIIGWFYAIQGVVSIFMPSIMGIVADRWVPAQKLLSICHALAGAFMVLAGIYGLQDGFNVTLLFVFYALSVAFYMPTLALSNSVAFNGLVKNGLDTVKDFPPIRVFGTIGFIITMLAVSIVGYQENADGVREYLININNLLAAFGLDYPVNKTFVSLQFTSWQFTISGALSLILAAYSLTLPHCPIKGKASASTSLVQALGLDAFKLFKERRMAIFFVFSMLLGVSLQITNGYAGTYLAAFQNAPEYSHSLCAQYPNVLVSLSQISETCCILLIPICLKRFGIKRVMMIAMAAWVFRFGLFGTGNPGPTGVWMFVGSCIVYGVAFDFFNISGALFVDQNTNSEIRSSAQGLFMLMTNGLGATIGTIGAMYVCNYFVPAVSENPSVAELTANIEGWRTSWFIFAAYALVVLILFAILFKEKKTLSQPSALK